MAVKIIIIGVLVFVISFVIYSAYSINNPQSDPQRIEKIQDLVSLQIENCLKENHSIEICDASIEEFVEIARLELDK
ncbi:hypothetical protein C6990_00775 [Nitrosopumilus sp. b3]|uniref:hypothetical protein n=1 Tax=Nitrosopumilus sp. b3 TaxID=2109909 RepID=UPI0015F38518|nr:hypothetical protein [Nitrosopumilus sp. b3]KAF6248010.1 hypothetical protein C6990_00775 [Nitrosopumilus sp. b3]